MTDTCGTCHHDHVNGYTGEFQADCTDLDYNELGEPDAACYCREFVPAHPPPTPARKDGE